MSTIGGAASSIYDEVDEGSLPTETELTLMCLDYLRDLRRIYDPEVLKSLEGIDANYLTMACWALNRAFVSPSHLTSQVGNDCFFETQRRLASSTKPYQFPSLALMERELLGHEDDADYEYVDEHASNLHRFYPLAGLSSRNPLSLGELVASGLTGLGARSRLQAERDMIESPLFEQFVQAVQSKGFFDDPENETPKKDPREEKERLRRQQEVYDDRYRKVVAKFRSKLASKADADVMGDLVAQGTAEAYVKQRIYRVHHAIDEETKTDVGSNFGTEASYVRRTQLATKLLFGALSQEYQEKYEDPNMYDEMEAEKMKTKGNTQMQNKEFAGAIESYTAALRLSPAGPNSHVYFSNRAAALVSQKQYHEAILDSERSLALKPDYGKAHARLGLAHYLLGNYRQALEAYTVALKYEPNNASSKNYLDKAAKKLADSGDTDKSKPNATSYSVISEWEKSKNGDTEAEQCKNKGNTAMANRQYKLAAEYYTQALKHTPRGPQTHVYFANRAAAYCYLERYKEAEKDSLRAVELVPTYGKAHARLGLSRYFLGKYSEAAEAYTESLKYDPDNASSKSYLAKCKSKLEVALPEGMSHDVVQKMMDDPKLRRMAAKAMTNPTSDLVDDPEMRTMVKQAMEDPAILAALGRS